MTVVLVKWSKRRMDAAWTTKNAIIQFMLDTPNLSLSIEFLHFRFFTPLTFIHLLILNIIK